ncbi:MAG: MAPEG family protein [Martelella sp.]|uniref:MAPEG family protein n=1 Tax=Martelella sp. TaxID=1969699 RepID=UPI00324279FF
MTDKEEFRVTQRRVAFGMAASMAIALVAIAAALLLADGPSLPVADRLAFAARADVFVIIWLAAAIANVARLRFFSPQDMDGSGMSEASEKVRIGNAVLQNTLEQAVLAIPVHLALAALLPRPAALIMVLVGLFSVGRALFWFGYRKGAAARAFGFALTFYPSLLSLVLAVFFLLTGWSIQG